ncbi:MAG: ATP-binding cassette domain-containing protein, partial [Sphingomonadaceae bacterium]
MALAGADLSVAAGEHVAIIGPSGAGKSSLLAALAGVVPAEGRRRVAGRVVRIRQDLALSPRRSALANVLAGARGEPGTWGGLRLPPGARPRALALLERVGLGHRIHARVDRLSGGEAQRVAIARALMRAPDVLLADEPVASLDPATARSVMRLLDELRRERGLTLLSVLHDHALAHEVADRVAWLEAGHVAGQSAGAGAAPPVAGAARPHRDAGPPASPGLARAAMPITLAPPDLPVLEPRLPQAGPAA